jgi:hypothetical protein
VAPFLNGAVAMACVAIGAFFMRFWRDSSDRLFLCLAVAFWIFAINYAALGVLPRSDERLPYMFVLRLIGFVAIIAGLILKDRELIHHLARDDHKRHT